MKKNFKEVTIKPKEKNVTVIEKKLEIVHTTIQEDIKLCEYSYNVFLLFYSYLRARKIGQSWNGGWMASGIRITQAGDVYTMVYREDNSEYTYVFDRKSFVDISHIILQHTQL